MQPDGQFVNDVPMDSPPMRTLLERMTNPTAQDLQASAQLQQLARGDVMVIVDRITQMLKHLENRRDDVAVSVKRDNDGWTIRIDMPGFPG